MVAAVGQPLVVLVVGLLGDVYDHQQELLQAKQEVEQHLLAMAAEVAVVVEWLKADLAAEQHNMLALADPVDFPNRMAVEEALAVVEKC